MHCYNLLSRFALLVGLSHGLIQAGVTVLVDEPSRLIAEITTSSPKSVSLQSGDRWLMTGFANLNRPGQPDIPVWRFQLVGAQAPQVRIQLLASEELSSRNTVVPVPRWVTTRQSVSEVNALEYGRSSSLQLQWGKVGYWRGIPLLAGELPLLALDEQGKPRSAYHRLRVEFTWPTQGDRGQALPKDLIPQVLNPRGGAALWKPSARPLAKRSISRDVRPSKNLVKIRIGDREIDQFDEDGFYALTFQALSSAGLAPAGMPIRNIRVYTGPQDTITSWMDTLPQQASTLRSVPLEIVDATKNGTFDLGDTLKFYAQGTSLWKRIKGGETPVRYAFGTDPYSFYNYYFLDFDGGGNAVKIDTVGAGPTVPYAETGQAYAHAEKDLGTAFCDPAGKLDNDPGFEWHWFWRGDCHGKGDSDPVTFRQDQVGRPQTADLPGYAGDSVFLGFFVFRGLSQDEFEVRVKGVGDTLHFLNWTQLPGSWYSTRQPLPNGKLEFDPLIWRGGNRRFEGYTVAYQRRFEFTGKPFWILPDSLGARRGYRIRGSSPFRVLKVEGGLGVAVIKPNSDGAFSDSLSADSDARYWVYSQDLVLGSDALQAETQRTDGSVLQNLATGDGNEGSLPEYLIVTHDSLLPAALDLKAYRSLPERAMPMRSAVVRVRDIYRQFSGGRVNPVAIRDFLRYAVNHWSPDGRSQNPLRFVMLLGDGHYDLRNIKTNIPNWVPPFEDFDDPSDANCSDDFFVTLDPEDQNNFFGGGDRPVIDLALGRVPVGSLNEANQYIAKVKAYESPAGAGDWRSRVVLTADDQWQHGATNDLDPIQFGHTNDTERLGDIILGRESGVDLHKVYLLDYALNSAWRKPESAQDLIQQLNRGSLVTNYVGHGAFNQWADEVLLYTNDALPQLNNSGRNTLLNSFSCTVGRFDNLQNDVLTEQFVRQKAVGAIAGISATRESYPGPNIALAGAVYSRLFPSDTSKAILPIGMALLNAKNSSETSNNVNDSKYGLMGDPAVHIKRPRLPIRLLSTPDTLRALDCSQIVGTIEGGSGNGFVHAQILSGKVRKNYVNLGISMLDQYQDKRGTVLFERTVPYAQGRFSMDYFIPKKIPYGDSTAQILFYAWDSQKEAEGSKAVQNLRIAGTATQSACAVDTDRKGPRIRISGCDAAETGQVDFPGSVRVTLPYCFSIEVEDSTGGVVSGDGPDEGTTLEIPGVLDPFHPQPGVDNLFTKTYRYTLGKAQLHEGKYALKVAAHDGYGNSSQRSLEIQVVRDTLVTAIAAYNTPNPMKKNGTTFRFAAIMPAEDGEYAPDTLATRLRFDLKIFNQQGRLVQTLQTNQAHGLFWSGVDAFGNRLANGIYSYTVRATFDARDGSGQKYLNSKRNILVISR